MSMSFRFTFRFTSVYWRSFTLGYGWLCNDNDAKNDKMTTIFGAALYMTVAFSIKRWNAFSEIDWPSYLVEDIWWCLTCCFKCVQDDLGINTSKKDDLGIIPVACTFMRLSPLLAAQVKRDVANCMEVWKRPETTKELESTKTLIKSTLSNIPTYLLSLFPIPAMVASWIEKLHWDFF